MWSRKNFILSVVVILVIISGTIYLGMHQFALPEVKGLDTPLTEFSAERAVKHIEATAVVAHPTGSKANEKVRDYIVKQLKDVGLTDNIQRTRVGDLSLSNNARNYFKNSYGSLDKEVENVYATLKGSGNSENAIMLVTHYDSVPAGPGAADDGYGIAILLETVNALRSNKALKNDIIFLFTDGEEFSLLGAKALIQSNSQILKNVKAVINMEARGNKGPAIMFRTSDKSRWLINAFGKMSTYSVAYSFSNEIFKRMPNDTDFSVFKKFGLEGLDFAVIEGAEVYHTSKDNVENVNKQSLQHYGECILPLVKYLGDLEIINKNIENEKTGAVYFQVLRSMLVVYPSSWAIAFCMITFILLIVVLFMERKKKIITIKGMFFGILSLLTSALITSVVAYGVVFLINRIFKPKRNGIIIFFQQSNLYMLLIILISLLLIILMYSWLSRKVTAQNIQAGALVIWSVLMITTSFSMVGASYLFTWPILFTVISKAFIVLSDNEGRSSSVYRWIGFVLVSTPVIFLFVPTLYFVYIAMTIGLAPGIILLMTMVMGILVPGIHICVQPYMNNKYSKNNHITVTG